MRSPSPRKCRDCGGNRKHFDGCEKFRPSPRKVGKALPELIVEMRWQDGRWWWCDVRLRSGPKFPPLSAYHRSIGYTRVKYVPSLPRKAGARRGK